MIHDNENQTTIDDFWILVDASVDTQVDLGEHDITSVEKIILHIGVDPEHNHLDPSSYESSHPLAPKFPSMHWGWSAGYRFVALEGNGGPDYNQVIQLHGLGDVNYFTTRVAVEATAENNIINIELDADYAKALENINVSSGVIEHGESRQAKQCLENFRDFVFTPTNLISSTVDFSEIIEFGVSPNPVTNGNAKVRLHLEKLGFEYDLSIHSVDGKRLEYINSISDGQYLDLSNQPSGIYILNLIKEGQIVLSKKILVK